MRMRQALLLVLAVYANTVYSQSCACDINALQKNSGVVAAGQAYGTVVFEQNPTTCDVTVKCSGYLPLTLFDHYSTTIDGASPNNDPDEVALLGQSDDTGIPGTTDEIQFEYMRCDGTNWVPYIADIDYLAVNDASDPTLWITYNAISCSQIDFTQDIPSSSEMSSLSTNIIHLLYGVPSLVVYALTVLAIISIRKRLNSTFVAIFLLTAVTNLITYLNVWICIRLREQKWFFFYYEFINRTVVLAYTHYFFVGFLYFAQNMNAFLLTADRFFALAAIQWKDLWTKHYKLFTLLCYVFCTVLWFFAGGPIPFALLVHEREGHTRKVAQLQNLPISLSTQVVFGVTLLVTCAILNVICFRCLILTRLSKKNAIILMAYVYFLLINFNVDVFRELAVIMTYISDALSLGPGVYTFLLPGPLRRECVAILTPCRKKTNTEGSATIQTTHTF